MADTRANPGSGMTPLVWVIKSQRAGENTQLLALASALSWKYQIIELEYRRFVPYFFLRSSLLGIAVEQSGLKPPWPDLIISASAKNEPVSRWIQDHAGKRVCLVQVGRPWAQISNFDLVVTTPQYRLPKKANVQSNTAPMHFQMDSEMLDQQQLNWQQRLSDLPRPLFALMVGGHSGPYSLDMRTAMRMVEQVNQMLRSRGGSLLVSTSARTPDFVTEYLRVNLSQPNYFHRWGEADNPYYAFLAMADEFIVTGDSVSMMCEACAMLKPVYIADLGEGPSSMRAGNPLGLECLNYYVKLGLQEFRAHHLVNLIYRLAMKIGPNRLTRDLSLVHQALTSQGRAVWLGENWTHQTVKKPFPDVLQTVQRIQQLIIDQIAKTELGDARRSAVVQTVHSEP